MTNTQSKFVLFCFLGFFLLLMVFAHEHGCIRVPALEEKPATPAPKSEPTQYRYL